jgi:polar amino acid transport system substrate-binding protein
MFNRFIRVATALLLGLLTASAAAEVRLQLYTEEYPPITFARDGKAAGLGTDVVEEIMRRLGTTAPIEVVPWARGYRQVTTLPNVGLFATTRTVEREKLFHWVGPISATTAHFYMRRGGPRFDDMEQARHAESIVIPRAWYLEQCSQYTGACGAHVGGRACALDGAR